MYALIYKNRIQIKGDVNYKIHHHLRDGSILHVKQDWVSMELFLNDPVVVQITVTSPIEQQMHSSFSQLEQSCQYWLGHDSLLTKYSS